MALYYPPITPRSPIFANSNYAIPNTPVSAGGTGTITEEFLAQNYLQFPGAQGVENFGFKELQLTSTNIGETATLYINPNIGQDVVLESVQTNGSLTIQTSATTNNTMILSPSTGLTFGDGTTQTTAYNDINTVQTDQVNTFQAPYLQTFNGPVNLNGATNGITQLSGNNSTLLATTAFVQDAVQISGVQVGDSPLLWTGANTNQYNAGTGSTLLYSYPYGLSQLYNLSGGNEEFSLVANNGVAGPEDNAFRIYCTQGNQTGTQLQGTTPQLILSNNNTAMFVRDGINVNNKNISNISTLSGNSTSAITVSSPISMSSGQDININNSQLKLYSGTEFSSFEQSATLNQLTISNNAPNSLNDANISLNLTDTVGTPVNIIQILNTEIDFNRTLNMNAQNITGIGALAGNGGNISCNSNLLIGTGNNLNMQDNNIININNLSVSSGQLLSIVDGSTNLMTLSSLAGINTYQNVGINNGNLVMNNNNISGIGILTGTGLGDITINSGLNFSTGGSINMGLGGIINCNSITDTAGQYTTTNTPPDNSITTAIATTGYVANAISGISLSGYAKLAQGGVQQFSGNNTCSNGTWDFQNSATVLVQTVANTTSNNVVASTAFVKANAGVFTQTSFIINSSMSIYYTLNPTSVSVITTYVSASNTVSFNSVQFVFTIATPPTFFLPQLNFSAPPFPGAPPATSPQYISLFCSNGATYTGQINWISSTSLYLGISSGPNLTTGMTFTTNFANLGAFTP